MNQQPPRGGAEMREDSMGRGDRSRKMNQRIRRNKLKARIKRRIAESKKK